MLRRDLVNLLAGALLPLVWLPTFEHRSPKPDDAIQVGMIDTEGGDRWRDLGENRAARAGQGQALVVSM